MNGSPLDILLGNRRIISSVVILGAILGLAYALSGPTKYVATASFIPQSRSAGGTTGLAAQLGLALPGNDASESPQFYADLLHSRSILESIAGKHYIISPENTAQDLYTVWNIPRTLKGRDRMNDRLKRGIASSFGLKTGIVELSVTTESAPLSQQIADRLVTEVNAFNLSKRQTRAAAERMFTEQRLNEVGGELRAAEEALRAFQQANRSFQAADLMLQRDRLARRVADRQELYGKLLQSFEQAKIEEIRSTPLITVIEQPEIPALPLPRGGLRWAFIGACVGATLGVVIVFGYARFFSRVWQGNGEITAEAVA